MPRSLVISLFIVLLLGSCSPKATLSLVSSRERLGRNDGVAFLSADFDYRKFEINVGIGGEPYYAGNEFLIGVMDVWYLGPESVTEMVEKCYDIDISATVSLELAYNLNKRWAIVGSFGGDRMKVDYFDPFSGSRTGSETGYMFDVLAGVRYRYVHKPNLSLYSQGQLGVTFHTKSDYWRRNELAMNPLGFQITALGITFGNRLYGFGEFGWGTEYVAIGFITGARIGIGYKF